MPPELNTVAVSTWIWQTWVNGTVTTVDTSYDPFWTQGTTGTANVVNANVWASWNTNHYTTGSNYRPEPALPTWEQKRQRLILSNRSRARHLRYKIERRAAERTAEELLLSQLTVEQREEYERLQRFHVIVGDKTYRLRRAWAGNLDVIEDGTIRERWCVHPREQVPVPDNLLAQKLMLESGAAEELRQIANVTPMRRAA